MGVGYDGVDVPAALERRMPVTHTPGVLNDEVADLAIGLMLRVARRIPQADRYVREGRWASEGPMPLARKVSGARLGIVGLGRIGQAIATGGRRHSACRSPTPAATAKAEIPFDFHPTAQGAGCAGGLPGGDHARRRGHDTPDQCARCSRRSAPTAT